jgi:hypothetical protein
VNANAPGVVSAARVVNVHELEVVPPAVTVPDIPVEYDPLEVILALNTIVPVPDDVTDVGLAYVPGRVVVAASYECMFADLDNEIETPASMPVNVIELDVVNVLISRLDWFVNENAAGVVSAARVVTVNVSDTLPTLTVRLTAVLYDALDVTLADNVCPLRMTPEVV